MLILAAHSRNEKDDLNLHQIRKLSKEEEEKYRKLTTSFLRIKDRLLLLHVNGQNYNEIVSLITKGSDPSIRKPPSISEINRAFMNYMSSSYSIREHLKTCITKDFGRKSKNLEKYTKLLTDLEKNSLSYAFYQDFRNFVQHCGFPVGKARHTASIDKSELTLTYNKEKLLSEYNGWNKSLLKNWPDDEINLSSITEDHHKTVEFNFTRVIVNEYGKDLGETENFYNALHKEAKSDVPGSKAVIISEISLTKEGGNIVFEEVPDNILKSLGIILKNREPKTLMSKEYRTGRRQTNT